MDDYKTVPHGLTVTVQKSKERTVNLTSGCRVYETDKIVSVSDEKLAKKVGILKPTPKTAKKETVEGGTPE